MFTRFKSFHFLFLLQLKRAVDDLNSALEAKEELTQRCHELDQQVISSFWQLLYRKIQIYFFLIVCHVSLTKYNCCVAENLKFSLKHFEKENIE